MTQLILFLAIAAGLFVSLYFLARSDSRAEGSAQALIEARQALSSLQNGLLPPEMIGRIFARDDYEFVLATGSEELRALFFAERKKIALLWAGQVRSQIRSLREFHNSSARFYARLSLATEIRLAFDFQALLCACVALELTLRVIGANSAPRIVRTTAKAAGRICEISEKSIGFLMAAAGPEALRENSAGRPSGSAG